MSQFEKNYHKAKETFKRPLAGAIVIGAAALAAAGCGVSSEHAATGAPVQHHENVAAATAPAHNNTTPEAPAGTTSESSAGTNRLAEDLRTQHWYATVMTGESPVKAEEERYSGLVPKSDFDKLAHDGKLVVTAYAINGGTEASKHPISPNAPVVVPMNADISVESSTQVVSSQTPDGTQGGAG
jgi:hypothetical protein